MQVKQAAALDGRSQQRLSVYAMIVCALFVALIAVGAFIRVPVPVCPFTLQFLFTAMAGLLLGKRLGALAVGVYVVLGLMGVPIFTEGGGPGYIFQPTFGYLLGFIGGAYVSGRMTEGEDRPTFGRLLVATLANLAVVYALGMAYLYVVCNFYLGKAVPFEYVVWYCFVLAVPGDIFLSVVAAMLGKRVIPAIRHRG